MWFLLILFSGFFAQANADQDTIGAIFKTEEYFWDLQRGRLYLDPTRLFIGAHGEASYILDKQVIPLPELNEDSLGYFIPCEIQDVYQLPQTEGIVAGCACNKKWCESCQKMRTVDDKGKCTSCGKKLS